MLGPELRFAVDGWLEVDHVVRTARILGLVPLGPLVRPVQVLVRDAPGLSPSVVVLGSRLVAVVSPIPVGFLYLNGAMGFLDNRQLRHHRRRRQGLDRRSTRRQHRSLRLRRRIGTHPQVFERNNLF